MGRPDVPAPAVSPFSSPDVYRRVLDSMIEGVSISDADGVILYTNAAEDRMFGYEPGELLGRHVSIQNAYPPEENARIVAGVIEDLKRSGVWLGEWRNRRKDGSEFFTSAHISAVEIDGRPHWLCVQQDITEQRAVETRLRETSRRLDAVLGNASGAVFLMDERHHCVYLNAAAETLTGYRLDELQDRPLHDVIHHTRPDGSHFPAEECPIGQALPQNNQERGEDVFVRRDGSFYPVAYTASPMRDEDARMVGTIVEVRDITEEKKRDAELRESEARFRTLADNAPVMVWVTEADGTCTYLSRSWFEFTGQAPEEALGFGWLDAVHPDDRAETERTFRESSAAAVPFRQDYRLRRADGTYAWAIDAAAPRLGADGNFLGYVGSVIDITDRKAAEDRLQALANGVPVFVWFATPDGQLHYLNDRWYEYTGQTPQEALPHGWAATLHPDDAERTEAAWADCRARVVTYEIECRYRRRDGAFRWYLARAEPLRGPDGAVTAWLGTSTDIHDRRESEQHLQLMVGELNHRVKNNLATVQAIASQTLRGTESLPQARAAFMSRLFALASAHDVLTREQWDGAQLEEIARGVLDPLCGDGDQRLALNGPAVFLTPKGALAIAMALHELCTNAAKYGALTQPGGRIEVSWDSVPGPEERRLRLTWRESGGPPVKPPTRTGFGSRLLERGLASELRGRVTLEYPPDGVLCTLEAPVVMRDGQPMVGEG